MDDRTLEMLRSAVYGCPVEFEMLLTDEERATLFAAVSARSVDRVVLACDPGVQTGWALLVRLSGRVIPVCTWVLGRRAVTVSAAAAKASGSGAVGAAKAGKVPARAPRASEQARIIDAVRNMCDEEMPGPVVVCEDWFAGPNPGTARDIAQQYYYVEAAADEAGCVFRTVAHSTWKKYYLGRGNMSSGDALMAYAKRGFEAHPQVKRWAGAKVNELTCADDAAALGLGHFYLHTEATT